MSNNSVECVECGSNIEVYDEVERGEILDCSTCGVELEVVDTEPLSVEEAPELEEDWGE